MTDSRCVTHILYSFNWVYKLISHTVISCYYYIALQTFLSFFSSSCLLQNGEGADQKEVAKLSPSTRLHLWRLSIVSSFVLHQRMLFTFLGMLCRLIKLWLRWTCENVYSLSLFTSLIFSVLLYFQTLAGWHVLQWKCWQTTHHIWCRPTLQSALPKSHERSMQNKTSEDQANVSWVLHSFNCH